MFNVNIILYILSTVSSEKIVALPSIILGKMYYENNTDLASTPF